MSRINTLKGSLFELQKICLSRNIAFVTFSLPGSKEVHTFVQYRSLPQKLDSLLQLNLQQGFIIAPFFNHEHSPILLLVPDCIIHGYEVDQEVFEDIIASAGPGEGATLSHDAIYESSKREFLLQVEAIKNEIQSGSLDKAVLSRVQLVERDVRPEPAEIFKALCVKYPKTFKYILNIPGAGSWIGATPEPLIEACGDVVEAVSLAGTQKLNGAPAGKVEWQTKEMEEQKFVTVYIENLLADFGITAYLKNGPFSEQAADLVHLKSTFSFDRNLLKENFGEFISALHPTPSVCGLPKEEASGFIRQLEKHERHYYTGFLGPLNMEGNTNLFVNLRCMRVLPHQFALFAGAGITASSDPGNEWEETEYKMQTLLSVLNHPDTDHE